jgi:hypothetical protein
VSRTVAVVGAGAAGLTAALRAAENGARVTLLNAHPKIGLKILISGGTRCNVTHREVAERDFNGGSRHFVRNVLRAFTPDQTREWIESLGVALKLEATGKYFPVSDNAHSVLDALLGAVERAGAELIAGARVVRVIAASDAARASAPDAASAGVARFRLGIQRVRESAAFAGGVRGYDVSEWSLPASEPDEWIERDAVILATGGLSFPRTGSDGTGYALARSLGHTIVPPTPALTPLASSDPLCGLVQGLTLEVELSLWVSGRRVESTRGSFLFTHFGYSGPAALDLSRHWLRSPSDAGRRVTANFLPGETIESFTRAWVERSASEPRLGARRFLGERLPDSLVAALCAEAGVETATALAQVDRSHRASLIARIIERELPVSGTLGYEKAEVTAGGVTLSEVDSHTLESRIVRGLYLCGEILDVEGRLGGFNFQWSWSSGTVAGRAVAK